MLLNAAAGGGRWPEVEPAAGGMFGIADAVRLPSKVAAEPRPTIFSNWRRRRGVFIWKLFDGSRVQVSAETLTR